MQPLCVRQLLDHQDRPNLKVATCTLQELIEELQQPMIVRSQYHHYRSHHYHRWTINDPTQCSLHSASEPFKQFTPRTLGQKRSQSVHINTKAFEQSSKQLLRTASTKAPSQATLLCSPLSTCSQDETLLPPSSQHECDDGCLSQDKTTLIREMSGHDFPDNGDHRKAETCCIEQNQQLQQQPPDTVRRKKSQREQKSASPTFG